MIIRFSLSVALLAASQGCASAQDEDPNFKRVVEPWIDAFADCLKEHVPAQAKTGLSANDATDATFAACEDERERLEHVYLRPPYGETPESAKAIVQQAVDTLRPLVLADIEHLRD
ncbi:hypothetical protein [Dongia sedimenti]|uniref:Uncharacterized protein n=1 Tax=Dongia sedimenti TaxID=3064282 RepID=A0ABU0YTI4_9PROT|nr:hypothetical protein [Rhodospirillaceae bacterium R-7]